MENQNKIEVGKTRVEVWKTIVNQNTGAESKNMINRGIVTKYLNDKNGKPFMVQIWNEELKKGHGMYQSEEFYAIESKFINVKFIAPLKYIIDVTRI